MTWSWARKDSEVVSLLSWGLPGEVLPSRITTMPANNTYFVLCVCCPDEGRSHCGQQIHLLKAEPTGGSPGLPNLQGWAWASALTKGPGRGEFLGSETFGKHRLSPNPKRGCPTLTSPSFVHSPIRQHWDMHLIHWPIPSVPPRVTVHGPRVRLSARIVPSLPPLRLGPPSVRSGRPLFPSQARSPASPGPGTLASPAPARAAEPTSPSRDCALGTARPAPTRDLPRGAPAGSPLLPTAPASRPFGGDTRRRSRSPGLWAPGALWGG